MSIGKIGKIVVGFVAGILLPTTAFAAPTYSGLNTVQYVVAYQSGMVTFTIGAPANSPWATCNAQHQFTVNTTTTSGQAIYDVVIRAQQGQKGVYIVGTGSCSLISGTEDVSFIQINP